MQRYILIDRYNHGCCCRKYNRHVEAILDDGYSVYTERKIKAAFNFGNGTMSDLKRFAKYNHCTIMKWDKFQSILRELPDEKRIIHEQFILSIK